MLSSAFIVVVALGTLSLVSAAGAPSNGWNDNIQWVSVSDATATAEQTGKPIMTVIHKSWCGACKALKPKFAESNEIQELSSQFVMVNAMDDEEPKGAQYRPVRLPPCC
mgnify:FL=1